MKRIAILFATREGHTHKIAEHIASALLGHGIDVEVHDVRNLEAPLAWGRYSALVLAASVHLGKHEPEMIRFVKESREELERLPTAFLSVSLGEAWAERPDETPERHARFVADVWKAFEAFFEETGWHPTQVLPVAGALLYTQYNFLMRFIMKRIARSSGASTDTSVDHEFTDWVALDQFTEELALEVAKLK